MPKQPPPDSITDLLARAATGDKQAEAVAYEHVYAELRQQARRHLRAEPALHTLDTAALVHEAYARLQQDFPAHVESRVHFYNLAARVMRRIIVDYARRTRAEKRGGAVTKLALDQVRPAATTLPAEEVLALDEALGALEERDPQKHKIVVYRYFGGYTQQEIGHLLGLTVRQVQREWYLAKDWLRAAM